MPPSNLRSVVEQLFKRGRPRRNFSSSLGSPNESKVAVLKKEKKDHVVIKWAMGGYLSYLVFEIIKIRLGVEQVSQSQVSEVNADQRYE